MGDRDGLHEVDDVLAAEAEALGVPDYTEGEASIAAWAQGDPQRALAIASHYAAVRRALEEELAAVHAVAEQRMARIAAWELAEEERVGARIGWIERLLRLWQHDFRGEERTTRLPDAVLRRRKARVRVDWDEDAALRYQQERHPEDVTVRLNKSALRERLQPAGDGEFADEHGEVVPFLREVPPVEPETWSIETP